MKCVLILLFFYSKFSVVFRKAGEGINSLAAAIREQNRVTTFNL